MWSSPAAASGRWGRCASGAIRRPSGSPPYAPTHALLLSDLYTLAGGPWALCPRSFCRRQVERAAARGFRVLTGFEYEFYLFRPESGGLLHPVDRTNYAETRAIHGVTPFLDDLWTALEQQGISWEQYYPEAGPGQHELSVAPAWGVAAADRHVLVRETSRGVAARHGLVASFAPKPLPDQAGSGCHLHLSLWRAGEENGKKEDENAFFQPEDPLRLSAAAYHFIGGVLHHLPALLAITAPSVNSYRRLAPRVWAGAYTCYGPDNREAPVRVPSTFAGREAASVNLEIKAVDGSANPYLALGAVLAAGLDGIERQLDPGPPLAVDPAVLAEGKAAARGVRRLPSRLEEAVAALEADPVLLAALGKPLARAFLAVRRAEAAALAGKSPEEEMELARLRY